MNKDFWSKTLKEKGLESPGRDEAVRKTLEKIAEKKSLCLLYTSPSPRDLSTSRMPSSA